MPTDVRDALYGGMPGWAATVFSVALVVIVVNMAWNIWLFALSVRARHDGPAAVDPDGFLWVFVVPALDEEVTIADSVHRLLAARCANRRVVVIDDGSRDRTAEVLAGIEHPDLVVLRRRAPECRRGKAAALNFAWRHISTRLSEGAFGQFGASQVVVVVVDADGRLDPEAPRVVAGWFADPALGGVQVRVRIYNRHRLLTWCQDVEFGVFAMLYQAARSRLGTSGMGGNGQFTRLSALDELAAVTTATTTAGATAPQRRGGGPDRDVGPWRDRLTEDQDLGLRLVEAGWRCGHDNRTTVDQQGLPGLRRLMRQRTRWAQGNLQAMSHLPRLHRVDASLGARVDLHLWLLQPVFQAVVGVAVASSLVVWATRDIGFLPTNWVMGVVFYLFGFTGVVLGCAARCGTGTLDWLRGWLLAFPYAAYTWLLWPVLARAGARQLSGRGTWAKTEREAIETGSQPDEPRDARRLPEGRLPGDAATR